MSYLAYDPRTMQWFSCPTPVVRMMVRDGWGDPLKHGATLSPPPAPARSTRPTPQPVTDYLIEMCGNPYGN